MDLENANVSIDEMLNNLTRLKDDTIALKDFYDSSFQNLLKTCDHLIDALSGITEPKVVTSPVEKEIYYWQIGLSPRLCNVFLKHPKIRTVHDILSCPKTQFLEMKGFGKASAAELEQAMHKLGYKNFTTEFDTLKKIQHQKNSFHERVYKFREQRG